MSGIKRSSPGASSEKNPLADVELTEADAAKLTEIEQQLARVELILGVLGFPSLFLYVLKTFPSQCIRSYLYLLRA
jgi:hypothetical protein